MPNLFLYLRLALQRVLEGVDRGLDAVRLSDMVRDGFLGLETVAGDAEDTTLVFRNDAVFDQLFGRRHGDPAGRFSKNPLRARQKLDRFDNLFVRHRLAAATAFFDRIERVKTVGGISYGQRFGDRVWFHGSVETR